MSRVMASHDVRVLLTTGWCTDRAHRATDTVSCVACTWHTMCLCPMSSGASFSFFLQTNEWRHYLR
jgi:hypothetical protein